VVIDQLNVIGVAIFKAKYDPPVRPHGYGPKSFPLAFELM
jgi:hypothetical protein